MAVTTMKLNAKSEQGFRTEVKGSQTMIIDQPAPMSNNDGPNPLEYFLASLPGCIIALVRIIAAQKRLNIRAIEVDVEGDIDKDVLMGKSQDNRAGFLEIRSHVNIDADMSDEEKRELLDEVERRCPVADVKANGTTLKTILK